MVAGRVLFFLLIVLSAGCTTMRDARARLEESTRSLVSSSYHDPDAEAKMAQAEEKFAAGEFDAAQPLFNAIASNTRNPLLLAEKARFQEAECFRQMKDYPKAVDSYHRLLQDHQSGAYRRAACKEIFAIADYWLDDTRAEVEAKQSGEKKPWLSMPSWNRLTDRSKPRLDQEGEALKALEYVWQNDLFGPYADKALFWSGYVHFFRENYEEADECFSRLVEFHKESPLRVKAIEMAVMAKNNATGGADYDAQKCAEAMQLVRTAEVGMPEFNDPEKAALLTRQKMMIRMQQAEKDFRRGQYHERTGHPGSAFFCYELVRRTYPGTKYSDLATARIDALKIEMEKRNEDPSGFVAGIQRAFDRMTGGELSSQGRSTLSPAAATGLMPNGGLSR